jgi:cyclophilin family peptidyl-prolyl cis-trans isomerase/Ni,Fe-hydrogenase III small subunit
MKKTLFASFALALAVAAPTFAQDAQTPQALCDAASTEEPATREFTQAEQVLEPGVDYRAILCTGAGAVYVDLFEEYAPITVNSFVFLAEQGYYNNTTFHRVIQDFMVQGGDPTGTGAGGPGYMFEDEFVGFLTFDRPGWLAMANANRPDQGIVGTNGSQFFITTVPTPHLDFRHTIFGEVLEGQDNVLNIDVRDPQTATEPGAALNTVLIITDPATVETTFTDPEPATREDVDTAFTNFAQGVPAEIEYSTTSQTTDEVTAEAADMGAFLASHNHEYRATGTVNNCNLDSLPVMQLRYTLDSFATDEDAAAALADAALADAITAQGLEATDNERLANYYTGSTTACDMEAVRGVTTYQRGHFLVTLDVVAPVDGPIPVDVWVSEIVGRQLFEPALSTVLRGEIR